MKTFRKSAALLAAVSSILFIATIGQAADVIFAFEANSAQSSNGKQIFEFDDTALTLQLQAVANATVDLTVNGLTFNDADFNFEATKDGSTTLLTIAGREYSATVFDGSFSFVEDGTGDAILTATFQDAVLFARNGAYNGSLFQSDDGADLVQFVYGPALDSLANNQLPPEGFSFALGDADPAFGTSDGANQLESFEAASSFIAQANVIPEPTTFVLTLGSVLGSLMLWRRRRS